MGFGFNLGLVFIVLPLSILLLIIWLVTRKLIFGKILGVIWGIIILIVMLATTARAIIGNNYLEKNDYYGEYIIDRSFFSGKQADWQYDSFRFKISEEDSIFFYVTEKDNIIKTYRGVISTVKPFNSERLVIEMKKPTHHVLNSNPTIYRENNSFYLVFNSPKFYNMFFRKGLWVRIEDKKKR